MHFTLHCLLGFPECVLKLQASEPLEMLFPVPSNLPSQEFFTSLLIPIEGFSSGHEHVTHVLHLVIVLL